MPPRAPRYLVTNFRKNAKISTNKVSMCVRVCAYVSVCACVFNRLSFSADQLNFPLRSVRPNRWLYYFRDNFVIK